jgi:aspartate racemase
VKTIGILGGLGPQATMDFEARLHRAAQRLIPQRQGTGYPPLVVYYHRHPPVLVTDEGLPRLPIQCDPRLLDAARRLGTLVDFLVITSNTPHLFQAEIEAAAGRPVLSMIDLTLAEVQRRRWKTVGVLGLGDPIVYTRPLERLGLAPVTLDAGLRTRLDPAIFGIMEGRADPAATAIAREAVATLRARGVDGIILGCTEIPLLLGAAAVARDLLDPAQLLVDAALSHAST